MDETSWYGSKRHFETEMSYEDYLKEERAKAKKRRASKKIGVNRKDILKGVMD